MTIKPKLIAAVLASIAIASTGAIAAASSDRAPARRAGEVTTLTADQRQALDAVRHDQPIPVTDRKGGRPGFVRDSEVTARDDRVTAQVLEGFRESAGPVDPDYERLFDAARRNVRAWEAAHPEK